MSRYQVHRTTMEARTCIEVHRTDRHVFFLRLQEPIEVLRTSVDGFRQTWVPIDTDPAHAARVYNDSHFSRDARAQRYLSAIISGELETETNQETSEMAKKAAAPSKAETSAKSAHAKAYAGVPTTPAAEKAGKGKATPAAEKVKKEKAPAAEKAAGSGRTGQYSHDMKITKLDAGNPKREGTASYERFALYKTGMTVGKFIELGGTMGDVRYDVNAGYISVAEA